MTNIEAHVRRLNFDDAYTRIWMPALLHLLQTEDSWTDAEGAVWIAARLDELTAVSGDAGALEAIDKEARSFPNHQADTLSIYAKPWKRYELNA